MTLLPPLPPPRPAPPLLSTRAATKICSTGRCVSVNCADYVCRASSDLYLVPRTGPGPRCSRRPPPHRPSCHPPSPRPHPQRTRTPTPCGPPARRRAGGRPRAHPSSLSASAGCSRCVRLSVLQARSVTCLLLNVLIICKRNCNRCSHLRTLQLLDALKSEPSEAELMQVGGRTDGDLFVCPLPRVCILSLAFISSPAPPSRQAGGGGGADQPLLEHAAAGQRPRGAALPGGAGGPGQR